MSRPFPSFPVLSFRHYARSVAFPALRFATLANKPFQHICICMYVSVIYIYIYIYIYINTIFRFTGRAKGRRAFVIEYMVWDPLRTQTHQIRCFVSPDLWIIGLSRRQKCMGMFQATAFEQKQVKQIQGEEVLIPPAILYL